jgi:hypothetical protein
MRFTINSGTRTVDILQGYDGQVVSTRQYPNSTESFRAFVSALDRAGFTLTRVSTFKSEDGLCATGNRFNYDATQTTKSVHTWSTSCSEKGTFGGNTSQVQTLFTNQYPQNDLSQMTSQFPVQSGTSSRLF